MSGWVVTWQSCSGCRCNAERITFNKTHGARKRWTRALSGSGPTCLIPSDSAPAIQRHRSLTLCVCVWVCVYKCVYACMHAYMYVYIHVRRYVRKNRQRQHVEYTAAAQWRGPPRGQWEAADGGWVGVWCNGGGRGAFRASFCGAGACEDTQRLAGPWEGERERESSYRW